MAHRLVDGERLCRSAGAAVDSPAMTAASHLLDRELGPSAPPVDLDAILAAAKDTGGGRRLVCRFCGRAITSEAARVDVGGAHEHVKKNPAGLVFRVGCFHPAPGAEAVGPEVLEHSWFAGHTWQIALCGGCGVHLGWAFRAGVSAFHGLIVDRLRVEEDPPPS